MSRRADAAVPRGATLIRGDVLDGDLTEATDAVDCLVHAATSPTRRAWRTEVNGTRNVVRAAERAGAHLVYVSIVGVDTHRFRYYRAKWAAEQVVEAGSCTWSIARATQFHNLLDQFLSMPMVPATPELRFQPVDVGEFAASLADLVSCRQPGRVEPFAGPEVLTIRSLRDTRRAAIGRAARLIRAPRIGFMRDFDRGVHLAPEHARGTIRWADWLASQHC